MRGHLLFFKTWFEWIFYMVFMFFRLCAIFANEVAFCPRYHHFLLRSASLNGSVSGKALFFLAGPILSNDHIKGEK
ncbi:hypothetical protein TH5_21910 [Thalassospira xianhensis MCCC 1A02616]|uniref:Uncharacterized protein n=1 Tax=Thalassospira xianhensis MCCC 1A02616 TaxID=1177929 RepID=A0A367U9U9_9PROT|nr:hypothetical protein TH5_21910 [Thalassospira xianhensis MCCC 1A02616]